MTIQETAQIMDILKAAYPAFAKSQTTDEKYQMALLWADMFSDDDVVTVAMAVKALIASDEKGFPPHIGAVKEKIRLITSPAELIEMEAWNLVRKVMRKLILGSGFYNNSTIKEENQKIWNTLPEDIRNVVGDVGTLIEWKSCEYEVIQSNFMRSYRQYHKREKEINALPAEVRKFMLEASTSVKAMPAAENQLLTD